MDPTTRPRTDVAPRSRASARMAALVLVALAAAGLGALRAASRPSVPAVPPAAEAGDLTLEPCTYPTEDGLYEADCGTLVVAENAAAADSPLIALPVVRVRARSVDPAEPIFRLEGGPGLTNMDFDRASRLVDDRDLVLVGYRGVDGSVQLDCPEVVAAYNRSSDILSEEFFDAKADGLRACAARFADAGVDPSRYGLLQQIDDLEAARVALGYERINLLSESAGTRTALIYAWQHPDRILRSVMTGVNPPGNFLWDPATIDEQVARYAARCADDAVCRARTDDLIATVRRVTADVPERWLLWPIEPANIQASAIVGLTEPSPTLGPPGAPAVFDALLSAAEGDTSALWIWSAAIDELLGYVFVHGGQHAAFGNIDGGAAATYVAAGAPDGYANIGYAATMSAWAGGQLADAWPADPQADQYARPRTSNVETLLIGGELDFVTPPQTATNELLPYLPNGREVVLEGIGHNASFWYDQPEATSRLVNTFFERGEVDDSLYTPQPVVLTPSLSLGKLARVVIGVLVALTTLMAAPLFAMARRVRRRGGFGPVTGVLLRSLYPIVAGLGGWSLGALIVLATAGVSLVDQLPAVLGIGIPVGLVIWLAWVPPGRTHSATMKGFVGALAGALLGGWLGFHAGGGFTSVGTTVIGAIAGANLALLLLDLWRARSVGTPPAVPPVDVPAPEPAPTTPIGTP
jgi:pimeloyl-ACP methyl ester carboxylesterase